MKPYYVTYHWEGGDVPATVRFMTVEAGKRWLDHVSRTRPGHTPAVIDDMSPELRPPEVPVAEDERPARAEREEGNTTPAERKAAWYWGGRINRPRRIRETGDGQLEEPSPGVEDGVHGVAELAVGLGAETKKPGPEVGEEPQLTPTDDDGAKQPEDVTTESGEGDTAPTLPRKRSRKKR